MTGRGLFIVFQKWSYRQITTTAPHCWGRPGTSPGPHWTYLFNCCLCASSWSLEEHIFKIFFWSNKFIIRQERVKIFVDDGRMIEKRENGLVWLLTTNKLWNMSNRKESVNWIYVPSNLMMIWWYKVETVSRLDPDSVMSLFHNEKVAAIFSSPPPLPADTIAASEPNSWVASLTGRVTAPPPRQAWPVYKN